MTKHEEKKTGTKNNNTEELKKTTANDTDSTNPTPETEAPTSPKQETTPQQGLDNNSAPEEAIKTEEEKLKLELEKMTETAKRLMADMTNLRRRNEEERIRTIIFANANLFKLILPGVDNLKRSLAHIPENAGEWGKGIEMSIRQLEKALEEAGLEKMKTENQAFNPELHEAVLQADGEENKIIETLEDGYKIQDFVIRHAKVKIGNGQKNSKQA